MWKYIRLLRLQDQYPVFGSALAAGIFLGIRDFWIVLWAIACTAISIGTFVLNELIDSKDVDIKSWNPVHSSHTSMYTPFVWGLFAVCTLFGLWVSATIGMFSWSLLMAVWCALYSLPPIRLKRRAFADILTQIGAGWFIPFGVPILLYQANLSNLILIASTTLTGWSFLFPYQLADFTADKEAGFRSTHVLLGLKKSLYGVIVFAVSGIVLYVAGGGLVRAPWLVVMPIFACIAICLTFMWWLPLKEVARQEQAFRLYVRWMKPITQLLLPYVIFLWFVW